MRSARRSAAVTIVLVAAAGAAARAQPATQLPDPEQPSRVQLGPVGLRPALVLREIGYDSIVDRDVRHSYLDETPYYVSTGTRGTYTQRLVRNLDGQVLGGWERVAYQALLDALAPQGDPDRVATYGAGVGVRLGDDSRVAINFDHTTRTSMVPSREYRRNRVLATVTYGF